MSLSLFHPIIREWFNGRFEAPTDAQAKGWTAISEGRHTLIAAPTGSGKTLAAFLTCIDGLVRAGMEGSLPDTTQVVYVSPLKALSNDIQKNLAAPLEEIQASGRGVGELPAGYTHCRTHRRHQGIRTAAHGKEAAPHPDNHPGVAVHPADLSRAGAEPLRESGPSYWTRSTPSPTTSAAPI